MLFRPAIASESVASRTEQNPIGYVCLLHRFCNVGRDLSVTTVGHETVKKVGFRATRDPGEQSGK